MASRDWKVLRTPILMERKGILVSTQQHSSSDYFSQLNPSNTLKNLSYKGLPIYVVIYT
jgi:hypothetical protein